MKGYNPYRGPEEKFQRAVAKYLDSLGVLWCHVPNEGNHYKTYHKKIAGLGRKSGVPDVLIFEQRGAYNGLAIELKTGKNQPTTTQTMWLDKLKQNNWMALVSHSLDEVIDIVQKYLGIK